jgi:hypothetical protein
VSLIETGSVLEQLFVDVQDELPVSGAHLKGTPRNGKQFVTHTEESPEGKNRISDAALLHVDHRMFDFPEILFLTVHDRGACKSVSRQDALHRVLSASMWRRRCSGVAMRHARRVRHFGAPVAP